MATNTCTRCGDAKPPARRSSWCWRCTKAHVVERNEAIVAEERARRGNACQRCGANDVVLEWHHRDRTTTEFRVGNGRKNVSRARLEAELAKCDLLCRDCHTVADALDVFRAAVAADKRWLQEIAPILEWARGGTA